MRDDSESKNSTIGIPSYHKGYILTAIEELSEKLKNTDDSFDKADIYYWLGKCYFEIGQYEKSIYEFKQANSLQPNVILYQVALGAGYFRNDQKDKAHTLWDKIKKNNLKSFDDYCAYGIILKFLNNHTKSLDYFSKAIVFENIEDKKKMYAYLHRGYAYFQLKQYKKAIDDHTQAIKINKDYIELYLGRGNIYLEKDDFKEAEKDCEVALQLNPEHIRANFLKEAISFKRKSQAVVTEGRREISKISQELQEYTPQSLIRKTIIGSRIRTIIAYGLYIAEIIIYALILYGSYEFLTIDFEKSLMIKNIKFITDFMHAYSFSERILFLILLKLTFFIPFIFLILAIRHTAKHLQMRGEFDSDTAMQWSFYNEIASELKESCKKNETTEEDKKYYREFLDKHIALRSKTNFELLHDVLQKKSKEKSISTKQISDGLDILQKAKDILTPPDDKKTP